MAGPVDGEAPLKDELPTPVGLVMFELLGPDAPPLPSSRDGAMVLVRVEDMLRELATVAIEELELATRALALATPVALLTGGNK